MPALDTAAGTRIVPALTTAADVHWVLQATDSLVNYFVKRRRVHVLLRLCGAYVVEQGHVDNNRWLPTGCTVGRKVIVLLAGWKLTTWWQHLACMLKEICSSTLRSTVVAGGWLNGGWWVTGGWLNGGWWVTGG